MLRGEKVLLRARIESDVSVLHEDLYDDVFTRSRADTRGWRPLSAESALSPFRVSDPTDELVAFSVVELSEARPLAGAAVLHGIDQHNRSAHIGLSLRPAFRGRGLASDAVRVLCDYGFAILGLNRLGIETLIDNGPMIRAAERVGFLREGLLRQAAWVAGGFIDEVVFGMLAEQWRKQDGRGERQQEQLDELVDEAGRESFPASDPPAF